MAVKTADKTKTNEAAESAAAITETFGGSPVTSDTGAPQSNESEINLANAKITVPNDAITNAKTEETAPEPVEDKSFYGRANSAGIGLIRVDGVDFRYVGLAPKRDKDAQTAAGLPITNANSTFTPLSEVKFDQSVRVKDPKSGEFFFPTSFGSWEGVELNGSPLVPAAK